MNLRRKILLVCRRILFFISEVWGKIISDVDWCSVTYMVVLCRTTIKHRDEMEVKSLVIHPMGY